MIQHVAAIDAGSNGIRLVIGAVNDDGSVDEVYNLREAVRLGADAFSTGRFSPATLDRAVAAFTRFRARLDEYDVVELRAVATSASREASNSDELVAAVREAVDIELEIIDGLDEAQLIFRAVDGQVELTDKRALLIDMGGGSVEVTVARNRRALACETLPWGPVRLLQRLQQRGLTEKDVPDLLARRRGTVRSMIEAELENGDAAVDFSVGTGGNIVRMAKLSRNLFRSGSGDRVDLDVLEQIIERLMDLTIEQRINEYGMRPDRADVVAIASMIVHMIMEEAGVERLSVPGVGLKEGLLQQVARRVVADARSPRMLL